MSICDSVREHYVAQWGAPTAELEFKTQVDSIDVLKWSASDNGQGVDLYVTLGASDWFAKGSEDHRVEFFLGLAPGRDEVASSLAALGLYSARENVALGHGHTVPSDGPLWTGTEMNAFLIVEQIEDLLLPRLALADGVHVEFLQATPLFESELNYKRSRGLESLMLKWEEKGVRFWDPTRSPVPAS